MELKLLLLKEKLSFSMKAYFLKQKLIKRVSNKIKNNFFIIFNIY